MKTMEFGHGHFTGQPYARCECGWTCVYWDDETDLIHVCDNRFQNGDRICLVTNTKNGQTFTYGTFDSYSECDDNGAYVRFDDPSLGAETYVTLSDLTHVCEGENNGDLA